MLNLTQRLTLGCTLLVALSLTLAVWVHRELAPIGAAAGHTTKSLLILWTLSGCAILVAVGTLLLVLLPIQRLSKDIRRIASGDLAHRTEWGRQGTGGDSFGVIANEMNRLAVRLRELRETEAGRRQMEFQLSDAVLQSIFEPIIVTDSKGHVLKLNQSAAEVLGAGATDRMALINLANTPGGDRILDAIRNAVSMQKAVATEDEAALLPMRIGEHERSYRLRTTPMRDSEGRLLGAVTTLEDVTSLQDTDRFKTQFIAVASQKLRDPLLQLRRGLYALGMGFAGELRPLQTELVASAGQEAQKLDDLMADLIEVAELDSGKREPQLEKLRPYALLVDARNQVADEASHKGIRLEIKAFADLSHIQADRRAVRTILYNLLSNALRYTPEGGEVVLEAEERKKFIQFTVRDTGKGIATERLSTIFDRFSALSDSGTGLGLALVRRLVESLDGQISVESRLGHGATFRFTLPVAALELGHHPVEVG
ncbi:sensor histidine kinase [Acidicapsa ligni]|uniref:sensor histidine kinase n=1 Tax=Acidicapsa ligni TaxID=542300 RepID=UPI0021E06F6A|nr:ATP-binding protein [Acidicapsa ligni]